MKIVKYLGLVIGVFVLAIMIYVAKPSEVWKAISDANISLLLVGFFAYAPIMVIRAMRWQPLIKENVHFRTILKALCVGTMANNILPSKMGAVIRAISLSRKGKTGLGSSFASVFVDNILEVSFVLFSCLVVSYFAISGEIMNTIFVAVIVFFALILLTLIMYSILQSKVLMGLLMKVRFFRKVEDKTDLIADVKRYVKWLVMKNILVSYVWTALIWLNTALVTYLVTLSLNAEVVFSIIYIASTLPFVIGIAALVPGGYGVQDASMAGILYVGGVGFAAATSIAILFRFIYLFWVTGFGFIGIKDIRMGE